MTGKLIVIYGVNNLGKTTQVDLLAAALHRRGLAVKKRKVPNYETSSGKFVYKALRSQVEPLTATELELAIAVNIHADDYQVRQTLAEGTTLVSEDYWQTTLAWSAAKKVSLELMGAMLGGLLPADLGILLDGKRFAEAKEPGHVHELNDALTDRAQEEHRKLGEQFGWHPVNANQPIGEVHDQILQIVVDSGLFSEQPLQ